MYSNSTLIVLVNIFDPYENLMKELPYFPEPSQYVKPSRYQCVKTCLTTSRNFQTYSDTINRKKRVSKYTNSTHWFEFNARHSWTCSSAQRICQSVLSWMTQYHRAESCAKTLERDASNWWLISASGGQINWIVCDFLRSLMDSFVLRHQKVEYLQCLH